MTPATQTRPWPRTAHHQEGDVSLVGQGSAWRRAQRALAQAAADRRIVAGVAAAIGAALAAAVTRELVRDGESDREPSPSRAYRIKRGEKPAKVVVRIARGRLDDALEHLHDGLGDNVAVAVHETRKDLKKTRAVLRLIREGIGEETYRRENSRFRDAGRALAGSRDAEAKVETLDSLAERFGDHLPAGFEALRERLEVERDALAEAQSDDDSETRRLAAQAAAEIAAGRAAMERWSLAKSGWGLLGPGLKRSYKRGRDRFGDLLSDPSPESVHEWRKRVKDLWYHLRLLRNSWPEVLGAMTDQAHELSDLLGDHHDLSVLAQDLESRPELAGGSQESAAITGLIEARQEELLERAVPIGERLYADRPTVFVERLHAYWRAWRSA
jgi:CHAD domain-containing protein